MDYLDPIREGHVYVHKRAPERMIQILRVKNLTAEVVYIGTTEKKNRGVIGDLWKDSIHMLYTLATPSATPSWEL